MEWSNMHDKYQRIRKYELDQMLEQETYEEKDKWSRKYTFVDF